MDKLPLRQLMPVVIACGGMGTRLREETEFRPKPMVEIGGKPILWHIMKGYSAQGYKNFVLCLGYRGNQIKEFFLNHRELTNDVHINTRTGMVNVVTQDESDDFHVLCADTGLESLTSDRLMKVRPYLNNGPFMFTYGDGVTNVDFEKLIDFHDEQRKKHGILVTITGVHPRSKYGLVKFTDDGLVTNFTQYPQLPDYTNAGFWVVEQGFFDYTKPNQMIEDALIEAAKDGKVAMYAHEDFWHSMDTYKDKEDLEKLWKTDPKWKTW